MESENWKKEHLFLDHISRIATKIRERCPTKDIIVWDDMMRDIDVSILSGMECQFLTYFSDVPSLKSFLFLINLIFFVSSASNIGELVIPMVWHYLPVDEFKLKNSK